jgi:hypothetical protein
VFWRVIRRISTMSRRGRERILSFGGPLMVVAVVAVWFVGLSLGAALVIHPALGSGVRSSTGETPSSFIAAVFAGGSSVSIVGSGALEPHTQTFRLFYFFTALAGTCGDVARADLSDAGLHGAPPPQYRRAGYRYVVWSNRRRGGTGDAIVSRGADVRGVQRDGPMGLGHDERQGDARFYPVLCYFRFREARYSMARTALVTLDAAALIRTALDAHRFGWVRRSAALEQLHGSARMLLDTLARESRVPMGSGVTDDVDAGMAEYVPLRADWDVPIASLTNFLGQRVSLLFREPLVQAARLPFRPMRRVRDVE